ncbi:hypothetical protein BS47DRAFT_1094519 [Hydnum rufescens UP504]|uniref:Uncharacterized protein n=1 Tax=Hydnum rufescens UP504 TaxID=1448309 RepID=A0A9P6AUA6_9AGAM|nr:hypothetical protein BS47DRAFT_1094519 [Hydnum rufescens UP504]
MKLPPPMVTRGWRLSRLNPDLRNRVSSLLPPGIDIGLGGRSGDRPSSPCLPPPEHSTNVPGPNAAASPPHPIQNNGGVWGSYSPPWSGVGVETPSVTKGNVASDWIPPNDSWRSNWEYLPSSYRPPPPAREGDFDPYDLPSNGVRASTSAAVESTSKNSPPPNHRDPLHIDRSRSRFGPLRSPSPTWIPGSRRYLSPPPRSPPQLSYRSSFNLPSKPTFSPELRDESPRFPEKVKPMTFTAELDRWAPYKRRYPSPSSRWNDRKGRSRSRSRERMNSQRFARETRDDDASARYRSRPRHHSRSRSRSRSRSTSRGRTRSPPSSRRGNDSTSSLRDVQGMTTDSNDPKRPIAPRPSRPHPPPRLSVAEPAKKVAPNTSTVTSAHTKGPVDKVSEMIKESNGTAPADIGIQPPRLPVNGDVPPDKPTSEWLVLAAEYARRDDLNNADWVAMCGVEACQETSSRSHEY